MSGCTCATASPTTLIPNFSEFASASDVKVQRRVAHTMSMAMAPNILSVVFMEIN